MSSLPNLRWELFVFDWDGTLMPTTDLIIRGQQHAAESLGYPTPPRERVRATIGLNLDDCIRLSCPQCPAERHQEYFEAYRQWYLQKEQNLGMVPGMRELLKGMKEAGLRIALATGKSRIGVERVFNRFDLWQFFEEIQTADENISKPNPGMLKNLWAATGIPCSSMVVIGDSAMDLRMASNAGASSIGMTYGASSIEELQNENPIALCSCVGELAQVLGLDKIVSLPEEAFQPIEI